ncbi:Protein transport protein S9 plasma membrane t-SNARE [Spiromyces aspiralis]|uniref:Protein transport protein S9 plasma membrane t-SNARE n=1 Tax=Spiromyces aspiralis TaxID=68401 RepID=A0ACC1HUW7_9FUNG|nr:Protein transport protein S9 plasma membrane t-SNARE [Spiromyces aspiralis]
MSYRSYNNNSGGNEGGIGGAPGNGHGRPPAYSTPAYTSAYESTSNPFRQGAQQEEDEEFDEIRTKVMQTKQDSLASTRKTLGILADTEDKAARTMEQLGQQGAQLNRAELNMDIIENQASQATASSSKLRTLNKSIFHIHIGNPFTRKKRREEELERKKMQLDHEQKLREELNKKDYQSRKRVEDSNKILAKSNLHGPGSGTDGGRGDLIDRNRQQQLSQAERSRYMLKGVDEDPAIESEINDNLTMIGQSVNRLKHVAMNMNEELEQQNQAVTHITKQSGNAQAQIGIAQFHLGKIK